MQALAQNNTLTFKGKPILIARVDIHEAKDALDREDVRFDVSPKIAIYRDQKPYLYDGGANIRVFLNFINRIMNPIVTLKQQGQVMKFLDLRTLYPETAKLWQPVDVPSNAMVTRVIAFIFDKKEHKTEINNLRADCRVLSAREDLRCSIVTDPVLVKKFRNNDDTKKWFPEFSFSTVILKRHDGKVLVYDLTEERTPFFGWINKMSLLDFDQLSVDSFKIYDMLRQPMLTCFVHTNHRNKEYRRESVEFIRVMKKIAPQFSRMIAFTYTDNERFFDKRKVLGITWEKLPAMAFNTIEQKVYTYP